MTCLCDMFLYKLGAIFYYCTVYIVCEIFSHICQWIVCGLSDAHDDWLRSTTGARRGLDELLPTQRGG